MKLTSTAFSDGDIIPRRFTCEGENVSPPLAWTDAPAGTHSFVVLCDDPDAPAGTWHHWAAYDIAADRHALAEAVPARSGDGLRQGINDFHKPGYGGPCPPRGHGPHHYHFRLLALSIAHLATRRGPPCREVAAAARAHALAEAILIGLYER